MWEEIVNAIINTPITELRIIQDEEGDTVGFAHIILSGLDAKVDNIDEDEFERLRVEESFETFSIVPEKIHKHDLMKLGVI
jgi:hypothetical protein